MKNAYLVTHTKNVQEEYRKEMKCQKRKKMTTSVGIYDGVLRLFDRQSKSSKLKK